LLQPRLLQARLNVVARQRTRVHRMEIDRKCRPRLRSRLSLKMTLVSTTTDQILRSLVEIRILATTTDPEHPVNKKLHPRNNNIIRSGILRKWKVLIVSVDQVRTRVKVTRVVVEWNEALRPIPIKATLGHHREEIPILAQMIDDTKAVAMKINLRLVNEMRTMGSDITTIRIAADRMHRPLNRTINNPGIAREERIGKECDHPSSSSNKRGHEAMRSGLVMSQISIGKVITISDREVDLKCVVDRSV